MNNLDREIEDKNLKISVFFSKLPRLNAEKFNISKSNLEYNQAWICKYEGLVSPKIYFTKTCIYSYVGYSGGESYTYRAYNDTYEGHKNTFTIKLVVFDAPILLWMHRFVESFRKLRNILKRIEDKKMSLRSEWLYSLSKEEYNSLRTISAEEYEKRFEKWKKIMRSSSRVP